MNWLQITLTVTNLTDNQKLHVLYSLLASLEDSGGETKDTTEERDMVENAISDAKRNA